MVADASIWGRCGSITGSRWKLVEASGRNYRKLEVSVESMGVFTTSMQAPTTPMEGSINLHAKNISMKIFLGFVKLAKIVWRHGGGVLSQTVKFNRGQSTSKVHFHKYGKKGRTIYRIKKKALESIPGKYVSCRLSLVSRVFVILLSKLGRENMRL